MTHFWLNLPFQAPIRLSKGQDRRKEKKRMS